MRVTILDVLTKIGATRDIRWCDCHDLFAAAEYWLKRAERNERRQRYDQAERLRQNADAMHRLTIDLLLLRALCVRQPSRFIKPGESRIEAANVTAEDPQIDWLRDWLNPEERHNA